MKECRLMIPATIYREVYSLYTTTEKLADPAKRADIVSFVRALNQTLEAFNSPNASIYNFVAQKVGMDAEIVSRITLYPPPLLFTISATS